MTEWIRPGRPLLIAHRGHSTGAPEQTMAAYRLAVELGAEMIEADVRLTADDRLIMFHDATLERTTSGRGPVAAASYDDIRALDAGSWFGDEFAGERVPTLDELFELAQETGIRLCLEAKGTPGQEQLRVALRIADEIASRGRLAVDVLSSFDHPALAAAVERHPELPIAPDRLPERGPSTADDIVQQATRIGAPIVQHHHADMDRAMIEGSHERGVAIWAWPTTDRAEVARSFELGADGLMGDDVAALVERVRGSSR